MADRYTCVGCRKQVAGTKNGRYRSHTDGSGDLCDMASQSIPEHVLAQPAGKDDAPDVPQEGVDYSVCPQCGRKVKLTRLGYFEPHDQTMRGDDRCPVSGVRAKHARRIEDKLLPGDKHAHAEPKVKDSARPAANRGLAITSPAPTSTNADAGSSPTEPLPTSGTAERPPHEVNLARDPMSPRVAERLAALEDATVHLEGEFPAKVSMTILHSARPASSSASTESGSRPSSTSTSGTSSAPSTPSGSATTTSSDAPEVSARAVLYLAPLVSGGILQPFSHILQPEEWAGPVVLQPELYEKVRALPMSDLAKELATKIKETFYSYSNRKTKDNRSAQTTLGPSEIGTPCDRRLAMALMGVPAVNPGGDGWAAFVGTCTHVGMADVYTFADADTGRYAVEMPVFLGVPAVPRGTTDLLDRRDGTVVDWKVMGKYSLDKFRKEGPSPTYRTQGHVYGLGAERGGEKVRNVAIVGLPRAGSSLDEMYVWTEKYDRKFAQAALDRVARIADHVQEIRRVDGLGSVPSEMSTAQVFPVGDDCLYCPFHLKGDKEMNRGCPGK